MSEETKKVEKTEQEAKQEVKPAELSEQELDKVAGGGALADAIGNVYKPVTPSGGGNTTTPSVSKWSVTQGAVA